MEASRGKSLPILDYPFGNYVTPQKFFLYLRKTLKIGSMREGSKKYQHLLIYILFSVLCISLQYYLHMDGRGNYEFKPIDLDTIEFGS